MATAFCFHLLVAYLKTKKEISDQSEMVKACMTEDSIKDGQSLSLVVDRNVIITGVIGSDLYSLLKHIRAT